MVNTKEKTNREYNWDAAANSFGSIQDGLGADEKLLYAAGELPRGDRGSIQMHGNRFSRGKLCFDDVSIDIDTWLRNRRSDANRGWFVAAIHCCLLATESPALTSFDDGGGFLSYRGSFGYSRTKRERNPKKKKKRIKKEKAIVPVDRETK